MITQRQLHKLVQIMGNGGLNVFPAIGHKLSATETQLITKGLLREAKGTFGDRKTYGQIVYKPTLAADKAIKESELSALDILSIINAR